MYHDIVFSIFQSWISVFISSPQSSELYTESNVRPHTTNTAYNKKIRRDKAKEDRVQLYGDRRETIIRDPPSLITRPKSGGWNRIHRSSTTVTGSRREEEESLDLVCGFRMYANRARNSWKGDRWIFFREMDGCSWRTPFSVTDVWINQSVPTNASSTPTPTIGESKVN